MKKTRLDTEQPKKHFKTFLKWVHYFWVVIYSNQPRSIIILMLIDVPQMCRYAVIIVLWALLFVMIYKVLTIEKDYIEYDPFEILQIDPVSNLACMHIMLQLVYVDMSS